MRKYCRMGIMHLRNLIEALSTAIFAVVALVDIAQQTQCNAVRFLDLPQSKQAAQ